MSPKPAGEAPAGATGQRVHPPGRQQARCKVDVRVICGHQPERLVEMVAQGGFREDLYFRLNVVSV